MNEIVFGGHSSRSWPRKSELKRLLWSAAGSIALGGLYSLRLEDHLFRIERREMPLPGLGEELEGARLVHVSDLHASPIVLGRYLRQCVELINGYEPDFVAITGDFITGTRYFGRRVAQVLGHLRPRMATVACLGNHDYGIFHPTGFGGMRGLSQYMFEQLARADVFVMTNESRVFRFGDSAIQFVGVEDYWSPGYNPRLAFEMASRQLPTVALCHNPDAATEVADAGADWVLAGHTHGRQLRESRWADFVLPTDRKDFHAGHYPLGGEKHLYVNRGLGYGRRVNLNSRPEITLFTLTSADR